MPELIKTKGGVARLFSNRRDVEEQIIFEHIHRGFSQTYHQQFTPYHHAFMDNMHLVTPGLNGTVVLWFEHMIPGLDLIMGAIKEQTNA